ncbi:MAG: 3-isopropylmalate dehydratase [Candidatus Bathyarchaeota archaeon B63]|nr:MAG: 3-isopropylmalate dehydratase [Candidatus Bathyarchaeota archaeon B63]
MRETKIMEIEEITPERAVLIEGLPGLGLVGKIASEYLVKKLNARRVAELYSPHFAHYVLVDGDGCLRILRLEFYYWRGEEAGNDLLLLTGDCQAQTIEGQYEVASLIFDYAEKKNVNLIITLGGYQRDVKGKPRVFASATGRDILEAAERLGAKSSPSGSPIIGAAGILAGLAKFRGIDALCLLAETQGHRPDPKAAKSLLSLLAEMLNLDMDLSDLEREISMYERIEEKIRRLQGQRRALERKGRREGEEKIFYIS